MKLIQRVKIAHSFLQSLSNLFHFINLSLPMQIYTWLSKNFSKATSKNGEIGHFNLASHFRPNLKISCSTLILLNSYRLSLKTFIFCFNCVYGSGKFVLYSYQAINVKVNKHVLFTLDGMNE